MATCRKTCFFHSKEVSVIKALEEKILKEGQVLPGDVLRVSGFINQQIDTTFLREMGKEIARLFAGSNITKILTVEASGIAFAVATAYEMGDIPLVFAKKGNASNLAKDCYTAEVVSFTKRITNTISVSKEYIKSDDTILIIDDFLATGEAVNGLESIVNDAGAKLAGVAIIIEKGFQQGGDKMRARGIKVESLAIIGEMNEGKITFRPQSN